MQLTPSYINQSVKMLTSLPRSKVIINFLSSEFNRMFYQSLKDFKYLARFLAANRSKREKACYAGYYFLLYYCVSCNYNPFCCLKIMMS